MRGPPSERAGRLPIAVTVEAPRPAPPLAGELGAALEEALAEQPAQGGRVEVVDRRAAPASSYVSEVVTVLLGRSRRLEVFCKYGDRYLWGNPTAHQEKGRRGGVAYEAMVYRRVLSRFEGTKPQFLGSVIPAGSEDGWLFVEYLSDATRLSKSADPELSMHRASEWLAEFHQSWDERLSDGELARLGRQGREYLLGHAERAGRLCSRQGWPAPWFKGLCRQAEDWVESLLELEVSVIHGEFYPANILERGGGIYPVDWESAAVGIDLIDLASLTDGWPPEVASRCEEAYRSLRRPAVDRSEFRTRVLWARLLLLLRSLGEPCRDAARHRLLRQLEDQSRCLGLV